MKASFVTTAFVALASAQRPTNTSICDYYTGALLKENNATTQQTLLTLIVNTAVIGNYTQPNVGIAVPGILTPGTYQGTKVNLLQYFNGMLDSTNDGGSSGISVNFLDGGGAAPLMMNMAANNTSSAQYMLLTHLYEYFAVLLGCSQYGSKVTPYAGSTNMYEVHKYMALSNAEFGYFVEQVGLSALSFGAAKSDVDAVGMALNSAFGLRCAPPAAIPTTASAEPQAICIQSDCTQAPTPDCSIYSPVMEPATATPSATATGTSSASASQSATSAASSTTAASATAPPMTSAPATTAAPTSAQTTAAPVPTVTYNAAGTIDAARVSIFGFIVAGVAVFWL